jgi:plasmid stabilization system protein ParE
LIAKFTIQIHPPAYEDINEAADWIAENVSNEKAIEWLDAIFCCIDSLKKMPERCPLAPENGKWGPEELRQLLFQDYPSKYRILFHLIDETVHVLQVRHGTRRWLHEEDESSDLHG